MALAVVSYRHSLCVCVCIGVLALLGPSVSYAAGGDYVTFEQAMAACQEYKSGRTNSTYTCYHIPEQKQIRWLLPDGTGASTHLWSYEHLEDPNSCATDTIPGGDINGGFGSGIYNVEGCAYTCGTNYSKLDGSTSMYDAQECTGIGQPYTSDNPDDYQDPPQECTVRDSSGGCLDMDQQEGGSCPSGTTYGEVNGQQVCVPSGETTDPLDPGTEGKNGQGGSEPTDLGTGNGGSDGTNQGGEHGAGNSTTEGTSTSECTTTPDGNGGSTQTCTGETSQETDYGTVTTPGIGENQFYKPIDKTAESVMAKFKGKVMDTPIVSGVGGFFDVQLSGTCPTWTIPGVWVFDPMSIDAQCSAAMQSIWPYVAAIIIASCGFFAFRIAFL